MKRSLARKGGRNIEERIPGRKKKERRQRERERHVAFEALTRYSRATSREPPPPPPLFSLFLAVIDAANFLSANAQQVESREMVSRCITDSETRVLADKRARKERVSLSSLLFPSLFFSSLLFSDRGSPLPVFSLVKVPTNSIS